MGGGADCSLPAPRWNQKPPVGSLFGGLCRLFLCFDLVCLSLIIFWPLTCVCFFICCFFKLCFHVSLQLGHVLRDRTCWSSQEGHQRTAGEARDGRSPQVVQQQHFVLQLLSNAARVETCVCSDWLIRSAATDASSFRSCVRPRRSQVQNPNRRPPAAGAASAITPASPTISARRCSWHTQLRAPPRRCEAGASFYSAEPRSRLMSQLCLLNCVNCSLQGFDWHADINASGPFSVLL